MDMAERKKQTNSRLRQLLPFLLPAAVLLAVLAAVLLSWHDAQANIQAELQNQMIHHTSALQGELARQFGVLNGYSASLSRENIADQAALLEKLKRCVDNTEFTWACFAYPDGTMYCSDGTWADASGAFFFQRALDGLRTIDLFAGSSPEEAKKLGLAVPVLAERELAGVLLGLYDQETFRSLLRRSFSDISGQIYICDAAGAYIIGTHKTEQLSPDAWEGIAGEAAFRTTLAQAAQSRDAQAEGERQVFSYQGKNRHVSIAPMDRNEWYIVAVLHETEISQAAMGLMGSFYGVVVLALLVLLAAILYFFQQERRRAAYEQKRAEEIRMLLEHDPLTGILTEKAFLDKVSQRLQAVQPGEYCLVYMDIYKFKLINEVFGYDKGNDLLRAMAAGLDELMRRCGGLCCRISGDNFALFMPHEGALIQEFHTKKYRKDRIVPVELYIHYGIYVIYNTELPADQLVDCAKIAQKTVKGNYSNYLAYYDMRTKDQLIKEQEIISRMSGALRNGEFLVYLQPQYDYKKNRICSAEALVRWKDPERGLIPPGEFIPVFEKNGFISKMDEYVWEQVCRLQRQWLDAGRRILPISVNVSRADLLQGGIAGKLQQLMEKYALAPGLLHVEITETAYMDDPQQIIQEISALQAAGFFVEMDDFGSGYSSLTMLKDVPFQAVKTDMKFLAAEGEAAQRNYCILDSVIRLAHQLGMSVIAEGVETREQAERLQQLFCDQMQGYFFSKPLPAEDYMALLEKEPTCP